MTEGGGIAGASATTGVCGRSGSVAVSCRFPTSVSETRSAGDRQRSSPSFQRHPEAKVADRSVHARKPTADHITESAQLLCYPDPSFFLPCGSTPNRDGDSFLCSIASVPNSREPDPHIVRRDRTGLPAGRIASFSFRLGVAGVLFIGIEVGRADPDIHIPEAVASLELILFVYTLGIQSGPAFIRIVPQERFARPRCWR